MTDATPTSGAAQTRRWFRRPWVLTAAAVLLIGGGVWANHLRERAKGLREIEKRLDVLRAMGLAVTPAELAAKYPDPQPEKDAGRLLQPGLTELSGPDDATNIPYLGGVIPTNRLIRLSTAQRTASKSYLDEESNALSRILNVNLDGAWFGSGFTDWETHFVSSRRRDVHHLVKVLHLMALLDIEDGRSTQAVRTISRAQAVGAAFRSEMFVKHAAFMMYSDRSVGLVQRLLNRTSLSENDLTELAAAFSDERPTGFRSGLEELTVVNVEGMFLARRSSKMSMMPTTVSDSAWIRMKDWFEKVYAASKMKGFSDDEFCRLLELQAMMFEALNLEPARAVARLHGIELDSTPTTVDVKNGKVSLAFLGLHPHVKTFGSRLAQDFENRSKIRCTRVALAIERHRLAQAGSLPESLADLVPAYLPEVPLDLFDGQPLRYRMLPKGYVVYSIGRDLSDDGGKEPHADPKPDDRHDLTFTVERPE